MYIQTEETPNPRTIKFLPGQEVMQTGTITFTDADMAKQSPLASELFAIEHVAGVFFGTDFICVTHDGDGKWDILKPYILTTIMDHYVSGKKILETEENDQVVTHSTANDDDDEIVVQIKELIDTRVRPAVAEDGGDIIFQGFEEGVVYLELRGACSGCPSSTATLQGGIENMLKHYIPEVERVESAPAVYG